MTIRCRGRWCALLLVTVVIATMSSTSDVAGARQFQCHSVNKAAGGWTTIDSPAYFTAPATPVGTLNLHSTYAFAVDPDRPARIFATNGSRIMRTTHGGCSWKEVFALTAGDRPFQNGGGYQIHSIVVPRSGLSPSRQFVYALVIGARLPTYVAVSRDGGNTWVEHTWTDPANLPPPVGSGHPPQAPPPAGKGLPDCSAAAELVVVPSHPRVAYVGCDDQIFATRNAGDIWEALPPFGFGDNNNPDVVRGIAVDPLDSRDVWASRDVYDQSSQSYPSRLFHSRDGGQTWFAVLSYGIQNQLDEIRVAHPKGGTQTVVVPAQGEPDTTKDGVFVTMSGGKRWRVVGLTGSIQRILATRISTIALTASGSGLFVVENAADCRTDMVARAYAFRSKRWTRLPPPLESPPSAYGYISFSQLQSAGSSSNPSFFALPGGCGSDHRTPILRYDG